MIPTVEATVKRITGWESRTKEFVHNVARTNQPERLNLWSMVRNAGGNFGAPELASLNAAYDGRPSAVREADGAVSLFYHTHRRHGWDIWTKRFAGGQWLPSAPIVDEPSVDKNPSAALQGGKLWLFWEHYDQTQPDADRKWRISFRTRTRDVTGASDVWTPTSVFRDPATARRSPTAVVDNAGGVWLFWLEETPAGWGAKFSRHDGNDWLANPVDLPLDGGQDPRVERDLFVLFHPTSANQRLWLFWARQEAGGPTGQSRWTIAYRVKQGLNPTAADWSAVRALPKATPDNREHDREPCAILAGGNIELFWSSTRAGGWTLWNAILDIGTFNWSAVRQLVATPYTNRAPLAIETPTGTVLAYRSNESLPHVSSVYGATRTLDTRYGGTTTVDTRNAAKLALRGTFEDFQTYTCDSGQNGVRSNNDRIAGDTIGILSDPRYERQSSSDRGDHVSARQRAGRVHAHHGTRGSHSAAIKREGRCMADYSVSPLDLLVANQNKGYVGLHIEQGVPLLDRDLNLLHDLVAATVRSVITRYIGNGIPADTDGFAIQALATGANNQNFRIAAGAGASGAYLVGGIEVVIPAETTYKAQRPDIAPLTTPTPAQLDPRIDIVYLDVFLTEIDARNDPDLANSQDLGIQTSVRLKPNWVVRVAEGVSGSSSAACGTCI